MLAFSLGPVGAAPCWRRVANRRCHRDSCLKRHRSAAPQRTRPRVLRNASPHSDGDSSESNSLDQVKRKWTEFAQSFSLLGEAQAMSGRPAAQNQARPIADDELKDTAMGFAERAFTELGTTDALQKLLEPWAEWKAGDKDPKSSAGNVPVPDSDRKNALDTIRADLQLKIYRALGIGSPVVKPASKLAQFELRDAIFCAGFAFEAYIDPVGGVVMQTPANTNIHFLSASVVSDYFSKLLVGSINTIKGLPDDGNVTCKATYGQLSQNALPTGQVFFLYVSPEDAAREKLLPLVLDVYYCENWVGRVEQTFAEFPKSLTQYDLEVGIQGEESFSESSTINIQFELGSFDIGAEPTSKAPPTFGEDKVLGEDDDDEDSEPLNEEDLKLFKMQKLQSRQWDILMKAASRFNVSFKEVQRVAFVSDPEFDTQLSIWRSKKDKIVLLAFRGTEQSKWQDFLTDTLVLLQPFTPGKPIDLTREAYTNGMKLSNEEHAKVHYGFLRAYSGVRSTIQHILGVMMKDGEVPEVWLTGHSLGGALANLCAVDMQVIYPDLKMQVCSFGAPRLGNQAFANWSNKHVPRNDRIVNDADVVARMPRSNFHHAGRTVLVGSKRELWVDAGDDSERTLKTRWSSVAELWEAERELMASLLSGRSLDDHMEDSYFSAVVEAHRQAADETPGKNETV